MLSKSRAKSTGDELEADIVRGSFERVGADGEVLPSAESVCFIIRYLRVKRSAFNPGRSAQYHRILLVRKGDCRSEGSILTNWWKAAEGKVGEGGDLKEIS